MITVFEFAAVLGAAVLFAMLVLHPMETTFAICSVTHGCQ